MMFPNGSKRCEDLEAELRSEMASLKGILEDPGTPEDRRRDAASRLSEIESSLQRGLSAARKETGGRGRKDSRR